MDVFPTTVQISASKVCKANHEFKARVSTISCLYMFVTFFTIIRIPFYQIMDYRDTRAYILDPCIQEFILKELYHFLCSWMYTLVSSA